MRVQIGGHSVQVWRGELPGHYEALSELAGLSEPFGDLRGRNDVGGSLFCVSSVSPQVQMWPSLFVTQRFSPDVGGFDPGVLVVPETGLVLIGAGERPSAYGLNTPERLWEDITTFGFRWWDRQSDTVLTAAECGLASWDLRGPMLWHTWVEPSWSGAFRCRMGSSGST